MARIHVIEQNGTTGDVNLDRVPVAGDFIAHGPGAVRVVRTVLFGAGGPADAIAYCDEADHAVSDDVRSVQAQRA